MLERPSEPPVFTSRVGEERHHLLGHRGPQKHQWYCLAHSGHSDNTEGSGAGDLGKVPGPCMEVGDTKSSSGRAQAWPPWATPGSLPSRGSTLS